MFSSLLFAALGGSLVYAYCWQRALNAFSRIANNARDGDADHGTPSARRHGVAALGAAMNCSTMVREISRRYDREHAIADALQRKLIRSLPRTLGPFEIASQTAAGRDEADVGGDFVTSSWIDQTRVRLALGDIEGSGLRAAAETSEFIYPLEALSRCGFGIPAVIAYANRVACERGLTVSLAILRLDLTDGIGQIALAGHEPALIWRNASARWEQIADRQLLLGVVEDTVYASTPIIFEIGDMLLLYTDGVASVGPRHGAWSTSDLMREALHGPRTPDALVAHLFARLPAVADDATIVAVRYNGKAR